MAPRKGAKRTAATAATTKAKTAKSTKATGRCLILVYCLVVVQLLYGGAGKPSLHVWTGVVTSRLTCARSATKGAKGARTTFDPEALNKAKQDAQGLLGLCRLALALLVQTRHGRHDASLTRCFHVGLQYIRCSLH